MSGFYSIARGIALGVHCCALAVLLNPCLADRLDAGIAQALLSPEAESALLTHASYYSFNTLLKM